MADKELIEVLNRIERKLGEINENLEMCFKGEYLDEIRDVLNDGLDRIAKKLE